MRKLTSQTPRVETGITCFEGDQAGVFISGDDCFGMRLAISKVLALANRYQSMSELELAELKELELLLWQASGFSPILHRP